MNEQNQAKAKGPNDPRTAQAVVAMLDSLSRVYPELEALPDEKVMGLEVRIETAIRVAFDPSKTYLGKRAEPQQRETREGRSHHR